MGLKPFFVQNARLCGFPLSTPKRISLNPHAFKCAVCERNMRSFIDYLADSGRVAIERRQGVCWYCKK